MFNHKNKNTSLENLQLIEDAVRLITSKDIQYQSIDKNVYIVCKEIKILIEGSEYIINDGYKIIKTDNIKHLLTSVLVEVTEIEGLSHFKDRFLKLSQLHHTEREYLYKLSSRLSVNITAELLYKKILFTNETAKKIGNLLNIPSGFVKNIRAKNRKAILTSIICEVLSNCSQCEELLDCSQLVA